MYDLKLRINGGVFASFSEDVNEQDITRLLSYDETMIEELLCNHAAIQTYWEALAIKYKKKLEDFKEGWCAKWWAHNRVYAKYVLAAYGDSKPTQESIKDTVILVYSEDTTDAEREKYLSLAFSVVDKRKVVFDGTIEDFRKLMYKHLLSEVPWYFESIMTTLSKCKEDAKLVTSVAEKLEERSFHMQSFLKLMIAKQSNLGERFIKAAQVADHIHPSGRGGQHG